MRRKTPRRLPGRRGDGAATRLQILEAAGEVFADMGFDRATGKAIAERAGSSSAAVNYYFGGIEGLYGEVLVEAHRRLLALEELQALAEAPGNPAGKLTMLVERVVRTVVGPSSTTWSLRVLSREMLAPSSAFPVLAAREILPKKRVAMGLIGEILGLPADHPAVARCCLSIIAPFALLLLGNRAALARIFPDLLTEEPSSVDDLVAHFQRFAFGGLAAAAAELKAAGVGGVEVPAGPEQPSQKA